MILEQRHKLSNYITGLSRFQGEITYEERSYTVDISLKSGENAYIVDEDNYTGANATLGYLYSNEDLSQVTLYIFEYDASYRKGWNGETGLIFSGPARTKEEAQSITDKIAE